MTADDRTIHFGRHNPDTTNFGIDFGNQEVASTRYLLTLGLDCSPLESDLE